MAGSLVGMLKCFRNNWERFQSWCLARPSKPLWGLTVLARFDSETFPPSISRLYRSGEILSDVLEEQCLQHHLAAKLHLKTAAG